MNTPNSKPNLNKQIYQEAAEWLVELRVGDVDAAARERLDDWFRESPHHIRAFLELSSIWEDGGDPDLDRAHSTDELIARAKTGTNVVHLEQNLSRSIPAPYPQSLSNPWRGRGSRSGRARFLAASAVGVVVVAGALGFWLYDRMEPIYATRVGEEKFVSLRDGSTLELNSRSRIRVHFSDRERVVDLLEGQAFFHVAKDPTRPFIVRSDGTAVRAVGTQFDVYRKASGTTVTVLEGRVAVLPVQEATQSPDGFNAPQESAIVLAAGEQVTVAPSKEAKPRKTDVAAATAWTQHELIFDSTSLADVAQEFNRYNVRQLVVAGTDLADFHVTGIFSSTDPSSLLKFLRAQRGISVQETDKDIRIYKK
jgi:transmembrane sensor